MAGDTTDIREIATRWKRQTRNPELLVLCEQAAPFDLIRLEDQPTKVLDGRGRDCAIGVLRASSPYVDCQ